MWHLFHCYGTYAVQDTHLKGNGSKKQKDLEKNV